MHSGSHHKPATNRPQPIGEDLSANSFFPLRIGVTAGKSDVVEAVIQWMLLRALQQSNVTTKSQLISLVKKKAQGSLPLSDYAIETALAKLEMSGWISESRHTPDGNRVCKLSRSAERYLPQEAAQWRFFVSHAHKIIDLVE
jgi:DNA-binding PadR family transcriptional regulator